MCDENTVEESERYLSDRSGVSRRRFGALTTAAAMAMALPRAANAAEVTESDVSVTTPDGETDAYFVHPASGRQFAATWTKSPRYPSHRDRP